MTEYPIKTRAWIQRALDDPHVLGIFSTPKSKVLLRAVLEQVSEDAVIPDADTLAKFISFIRRYVANQPTHLMMAGVMGVWLNEKKSLVMREFDGIQN